MSYFMSLKCSKFICKLIIIVRIQVIRIRTVNILGDQSITAGVSKILSLVNFVRSHMEPRAVALRTLGCAIQRAATLLDLGSGSGGRCDGD